MFGFNKKKKKKPKNVADYICQFCNVKLGIGKTVFISEPLKKNGFKHKGHKKCLAMAIAKINEAESIKELKHFKII